MRALVISGGGSKGAFAGGVAEYLINELKLKYEILIGTSTGSLIVPQLAIGEIDAIKYAYTNVTNKDIYSVCPFKVMKTKDGQYRTRMNHSNILRMFMRGKKTFGEHKALLKTLRNAIPRDHFRRIQQSQKKVICTVSNLTRNIVEYKYAADCSYEDYLEWMWTSASFVPFMGIVEKNGYEYADGGFGSLVPVEEAINAGATEVDVIVLNPKYSIPEPRSTKNAFDVIMRTLEFMHYRIGRHDVYIGHLQSVYDDTVHVNFIYTPRLLTEYSFLFDPPQMKAWWQEGYDHAKKLNNAGDLFTRH